MILKLSSTWNKTASKSKWYIFSTELRKLQTFGPIGFVIYKQGQGAREGSGSNKCPPQGLRASVILSVIPAGALSSVFVFRWDTRGGTSEGRGLRKCNPLFYAVIGHIANNPVPWETYCHYKHRKKVLEYDLHTRCLLHISDSPLIYAWLEPALFTSGKNDSSAGC